MQESESFFKEIIELLKLPIIYILLGYIIAKWQLKYKIKLDFIERQLREFYSSMLICIRRIRALGELREKRSKLSNVAWKEICATRKIPFDDSEKVFEPFKNMIDVDNIRLREEIIPLYDEMLNIFEKKIELANSPTQGWYTDFLNFVEIWHGYLNKTIPNEVLEKLEHSEESLKPFYEDLENNFNKLRKELSGKQLNPMHRFFQSLTSWRSRQKKI